MTKYATTKGIKQVVESDHNVMFAKFMINYEDKRRKKQRKEIFELKNPIGKGLFFSQQIII